MNPSRHLLRAAKNFAEVMGHNFYDCDHDITEGSWYIEQYSPTGVAPFYYSLAERIGFGGTIYPISGHCMTESELRESMNFAKLAVIADRNNRNMGMVNANAD